MHRFDVCREIASRSRSGEGYPLAHPAESPALRARRLRSGWLLILLVSAGCGEDADVDAGTPGTDAGLPGTDAGTPGTDAGEPMDSSIPDVDGAVGVDSGTPDSGVDVDAAMDAGFDASLPDGGPPGGPLSLSPGFSMTVSGDTTGGPTWNRPVANSGCPAKTHSAVATMVTYESRIVTNTSASTITVTATTTSGYDSYLLVYAGMTIPMDTLVCLAGADDGGLLGDASVIFTLAPGESAVVVVSGFENSDVGPYSLLIEAT